MPYDQTAVLTALRKSHPEFKDSSDTDLLDAISTELGEKDHNAVIAALGAELKVPEIAQPPSFGQKAFDAIKSIPSELWKDISAAPKVPYELAGALGAQGALNDLPAVDYASERAKGQTHEQASATVQNYIDQLRERSNLLQEQAGQGQEDATRAAATALSTAATGGAGKILGTAAVPLLNLALEGAVGGGTYAGIKAAGEGQNVDEVGKQAAIGTGVGAALGPLVPVAGKFLAKEFMPLVEPITKRFMGQPRVAAQLAKEALAGESVEHPSVQRLTQVLEEAGPLRKTQEAAMSEERGKRFGRFKGVGEEVSGEMGARLQMAELRGEMPRVDFETLRGKIQQGDIDQLFDIIRQNPALMPGEQARAYVALGKVLGEHGGVVPQNNEIELLQSVFGPKFVDVLLKKQPLMNRAKRLGIELLNVPRAIMSSMDFSAPFRQGAFLVGRPKQFFPAFANMFRTFGSQRALDALNQNIQNRATAPAMRAAGLALTDMGGVMNKREEAFIGSLAEKIPVVGAGIRASERAYLGFLNKLRADTFDNIMMNAERMGHDVSDPRFLKSLGAFVNAATGRGTMGKTLENAAPALSTVFFSPRLIASRVNLLNPAFYARLDPFVRKEALKSAMSAAAVGTSVLSLLKASGAQVETDPRSSDWGKVRIGDTRFDIFAGFQQYARLGAQLLPNFGTELPVGGVKSPVTGRVREYGKGFHAPTRLDQVSRFAEGKLAPIPSMLVDIFRGQDVRAEPKTSEEIAAMMEGREVKPLRRPRPGIDKQKMLEDAITPLALRDALDAMQEWGPETGAYMATPAMFGVGIQTMPSPKAKPSPVPGSILERLLAKKEAENAK